MPDENKGVLYIVATPIGNLSDVSPRALDTLRSVSLIAAEDTRVTAGLLTHFGIKKPQISYNKNNMRERAPQILETLEAGASVALVSDAGTPAVSDPGEDIVKLCHDNGYTVVPVPGPCAAITALCASGLVTGRFCFEGFLSVSKKSRREHLETLIDEPRTIIFYEAPHKLCNTLADLYAFFGDRQITVARELTKIHEQIFRTTLQKANEYYAENKPRGEFVLIIDGARVEKASAPAYEDVMQNEARDISVRDAVRKASSLGVSRNQAYKDALASKNK